MLLDAVYDIGVEKVFRSDNVLARQKEVVVDLDGVEEVAVLKVDFPALHEVLLAERANALIVHPLVDAFRVENVEAAE